jgi:hypothetical protein
MERILDVCGLTMVDEQCNDQYEFLLAFSSDSLIVLDDKREYVEWIVEGDDKNGVLASTDSEDDFLDAILVIKAIIKSGLNPLSVLYA